MKERVIAAGSARKRAREDMDEDSYTPTPLKRSKSDVGNSKSAKKSTSFNEQSHTANIPGASAPQLHQTLETVRVPISSVDRSVTWKFFNPGNKTMLDTSSGKLQIIGSRRIQMLIENLPQGATFVSAQLYMQKGESYEMIQNCIRCQENGIPKVFCLLPRRGREHDYPWVTFRITCTSSGKHWKGASFFIGAEFLMDPSSGMTTIVRFFSPSINVQSKLKSKDREAMRMAAANSSQNSQDVRSSQGGDDDDFDEPSSSQPGFSSSQEPEQSSSQGSQQNGNGFSLTTSIGPTLRANGKTAHQRFSSPTTNSSSQPTTAATTTTNSNGESVTLTASSEKLPDSP